MDGKRGVRWVNVYVRTREGNLSDRSKLRQSRCWNTDERHVNQSCWSWSYSVGNSTFTKHMISNNRHDAFIFCSVAICLPACLDCNLVTSEYFYCSVKKINACEVKFSAFNINPDKFSLYKFY